MSPFSLPSPPLGAGGRAAPIDFNLQDDALYDLLSHLNGVLFPGGGTAMPLGGQQIVDYAMKSNDLTVWGTCLGFEWVVDAVGGPDAIVGGFDSENYTVPLLVDGKAAAGSRLFGGAPDAVMRALTTDVTINNHGAGIEPAAFANNSALSAALTVLSTNVDRKGRPFVSTFEAAGGEGAPRVFGTQFHPEKNLYEWGLSADGTPYEAINHSPDGVLVAQYFANFLVAQARTSSASFGSAEAENAALFYNESTSEAEAPEFVQAYFVTRFN